MSEYKIHRYAVKENDAVFLDPSSFNDAERQIWNNYVDFVQSLPGHTRRAPDKTTIDGNTMKYTYYCAAEDGREEIIARKFFRELGLSSNTARLAYMNMIRNKGGRVNQRLSYTEVEFANGHFLILRPDTYEDNP